MSSVVLDCDNDRKNGAGEDETGRGEKVSSGGSNLWEECHGTGSPIRRSARDSLSILIIPVILLFQLRR